MVAALTELCYSLEALLELRARMERVVATTTVAVAALVSESAEAKLDHGSNSFPFPSK